MMSKNTIGVIVPKIENEYFSSFLAGIEKIAFDTGYTIMFSKTDEDYSREVLNTRALLSNSIAGLLISVSQNTRNIDHLKVFKKRRVPIVFFDRMCENIKASQVIVDDKEGAYKATEHLILSGYKRIIHIAGPKHLDASKNRCEGYRLALKKYKRDLTKNAIFYSDLSEKNIISIFQKSRKMTRLPDAIFAFDDYFAARLYKLIKKNGLNIPDDIAIVGFVDNSLAPIVHPSLTTVSVPLFKMGEIASKILIDEIKNGESHHSYKA